MFSPQWLQQLRCRWSSPSIRRHAGRVSAPRRSVRPRLEALEERLTPSADLVFTTTAQTLTAGQPSQAITVQLQDGSGHVVQAPNGGVTVNLSSSSPTSEFLDTSGKPLATNPLGSGPTIFIAEGTSSASFEYEDTHAGMPTLTATATGDTSGTQQETVNLPTANVIHVTTTQDDSITPPGGSLRAAILAANAAPGSTIVFDTGVAGTIDLTSDLPILSANTNIYGPGANALTIKGVGTSQQQGDALQIASGAQVTVTDLTLSDPAATAIHNLGSLTLNRVTLSGSGAAINNGGAALTVDDSTISGNTGMSGSAAAGITSTTGTANILNSLLSGNSDTALDNVGGTMTLDHVIVSGNTASGASLPPYGDPGGILNTATLTISNSTIANNSTSNSAVAAGLDSEAGSVTVVNSTFTGNVDNGSNSAGGIGIYGGTASISNSTISGNTATQQTGTQNNSGGGIDAFGNSAVTLYDTIVAGNTGSVNNPTDVSGMFASSGHNLIGSANTNSSGFVSSDLVGTATTSIDAKLGSLQNNGGPTPTLALQSGSPAIGAGSSTNAPATDQRGVARPTSGAIDIGAFETTTTTSNSITFSPTSLPSATVNSAYNQTITANGGSGTTMVTYNVTSTTTPQSLGLTLTASGNQLTISGTPTASGSVSFSVTATDSANVTATQNYTLTVNAAEAAITLSPSTVPSATVGTAYNQSITASGGSGTVTVTDNVTSSTTPASLGLTLTASGNQLVISGTPKASGTVSFTVTATDSANVTATQNYTLTVNAAGAAITLSPSTVPSATVGTAYNQTIAASGGSGATTVTYSLAANNSIPAGLTFTPSNGQLVLSGTPTASGTVSFAVTATDATGAAVSQNYTLTVNAVVPTSPPPAPSPTPAQIQQGEQDVFSLALSALTGNATLFFQSLSDYHSLSADTQQQVLQNITGDILQFALSGQAQNNSNALNTLVIVDLLLTFHIL